MFNGRDYHTAFEEACELLSIDGDDETARDALEHVEWVLWEAIRGVFFYVAVLLAALVVLPFLYLLGNERTMIVSVFGFAVLAVIATAIYWLCRLVFRLEVSNHVKGRRFGSGGID